ncbi:MAG: 3'-5' exonuclease [Campylobacter sp.]|nr:3'-5' exonuclease [Campylobacter sp.]
MSDIICIFDCETVPCIDSLKAAYGYEGEPKDIAELALKEQKERTGSEFLPVCFHKVITISAVLADKFGRFIRVSTMSADSEKDTIDKFLKFLDSHNPRLVSFNGRGFDLPMLMIRAMRYNLSSPAYFDTSSKELGKDKWTNYRSRYDGIFHMDLLDHISDFKAVGGLSLDKLCAALNLPGKFDTSGEQVLELYLQDELLKIDEYCESDVLNTYMLFIKYELLRGNLTLNDYAQCLELMSDYLAKNRFKAGYFEVFTKACQDEIKRASEQI